MTEFEKKIYEAAKPIIDRVKSDETKKNYKGRVKYPYVCNGVLDYFVFDHSDNKCIAIEYTVGVGSGIEMLGNTGYFDNTVTRILTIND